jgi:flagellar basal body-associated protein FliL
MAGKKENEGKVKKLNVKENIDTDKTDKNKLPNKTKRIIYSVFFIIILLGAFSLTKFILLPLSRKYEINKQIKEKELAEKNSIAEMGLIYVIDDLTVNTRASNGYRIVVAELAIESSKESIIKEIENREPQIRDVLIAYFRSHTAQEISDVSFQEKSRSEIIQIINDHLNSGVIDSVYYVKLILQ